MEKLYTMRIWCGDDTGWAYLDHGTYSEMRMKRMGWSASDIITITANDVLQSDPPAPVGAPF